LDLVELELRPAAAGIDPADRPGVPLAPRARAVTAEDRVRVDAAVPVTPLDLGHLRAARRPHGLAPRSRIHRGALITLGRAEVYSAQAFFAGPRRAFTSSSPTTAAVDPSPATAFAPRRWPTSSARVQSLASFHSAVPG